MDEAQRQLVTQAEFARRRGVTRQAVGKAVRDGRIHLEPDGRHLDLAAALSAWDRHTRPSAPPAGSGVHAQVVAPGTPAAADKARATTTPPAPQRPASAVPSAPAPAPDRDAYQQARLQREIAEASIAQRKAGQLAGELVPVAEVAPRIHNHARALRDRLMTVPGKTVQAIRAAATDAEGERLLAAALRQALQDLAGPEPVHQEQAA